VPLLAITGHEDVALAVNVMKAGAFDFLTKPFHTEQLISALNRAVEYKCQMESRRQREFLQARLATLGELSAGINREIASALDSINNGLLQLGQLHLPALTREYMDLARGGVDRIRQLIQNSKVLCCSNKAVESFDLKLLVEDCCAALRHEFNNKAIELTVAIKSRVTIEGVRDQIEQTLINILLNASHAVETGGQIAVSAQHDMENVIIKISDNGTGIPREALPNIFRPFYSTKEFGTGLGLAYCKNIVENHGGKISVHSKLGEGTTFTVVLPASAK
jgi:signal transduction histidine kinase